MHTQHPGGPARTGRGRPLVLGALLAAVLAGSWVTARGIERDIDTRVTKALGQPGIDVVAVGRDIELTGAAIDDPELLTAADVAARIEGVRRVTRKGGAGSGSADPGAGPSARPTSEPTESSGTGQPSPPPRPSVSPTPRSSPGPASADVFPVLRIVYSPGTYSLNRTGMLELNRIAIYLKAHPNAAVLIQGHSDSLGSEEVKKRISLQRAQAVQTYIVSRGIARERTAVQGLSDTRPIASNASPAGQARNRRVTITLEDAR